MLNDEELVLRVFDSTSRSSLMSAKYYIFGHLNLHLLNLLALLFSNAFG
jgi:hypothetical protein